MENIDLNNQNSQDIGMESQKRKISKVGDVYKRMEATERINKVGAHCGIVVSELG